MKDLEISTEALTEQLAEYKLSQSRVRTMSYHSRDTIRALVSLGLIKTD